MLHYKNTNSLLLFRLYECFYRKKNFKIQQKGMIMMNYQTVTSEPYFMGLPVNNGESGNLGNYEIILQKIRDTFDFMIRKHNKVLFVRLDLHFPYGYPVDGSNRELSGFLKLFREYYTRHGIDFHYIWAREQSATNNIQHYHCVILLDGNKVQHYFPVLERASIVWRRIVGIEGEGLINFCNKDYNGKRVENGIMIRRPSSLATGERLHELEDAFRHDYERCFRWASYLAKVNQKSMTPFSMRRFGTSGISS